MELKIYLGILRKKWKIVLIAFVVTYIATLVLTFTQRPLYQGRATYVVKLSTPLANDKDFVSAVDILSRRTEIATTYTMVANSRTTIRMAGDMLGLSPEQRAGIRVASELVPGTNVLEITVQAHDPVLARDFTNAVGAQTIAYTRDLYDVYKLEPLDPAGLPDKPEKPNVILNLVLGALMGLVLGAGLAFLSSYLQAPAEPVAAVKLFDEETAAYSPRYFMSRLRQELGRARRHGYPLAVAMINVDHQGALDAAGAEARREALRKIAMIMTPYLRDEDILAYLGGTSFACLLPDMTGHEAKRVIEHVQMAIVGMPLELERSGIVIDLRCDAGVATYSAGSQPMEPDELLAQAEEALRRAENATYSRVQLQSGIDVQQPPLSEGFPA